MNNEEQQSQSMEQRMIAIAQGEYAPAVIELLRSCVDQRPIIGENEFSTVVNAVTMEAQAGLIQRVITQLEEIRKKAFI